MLEVSQESGWTPCPKQAPRAAPARNEPHMRARPEASRGLTQSCKKETCTSAYQMTMPTHTRLQRSHYREEYIPLNIWVLQIPNPTRCLDSIENIRKSNRSIWSLQYVPDEERV